MSAGSSMPEGPGCRSDTDGEGRHGRTSDIETTNLKMRLLYQLLRVWTCQARPQPVRARAHRPTARANRPRSTARRRRDDGGRGRRAGRGIPRHGLPVLRQQRRRDGLGHPADERRARCPARAGDARARGARRPCGPARPRSRRLGLPARARTAGAPRPLAGARRRAARRVPARQDAAQPMDRGRTAHHLPDNITAEHRVRLAAALTPLFGSDAVVWTRDAAELDQEQALNLMAWIARTIVEAAIHDP